jgi:uncharacterized membrane protein
LQPIDIPSIPEDDKRFEKDIPQSDKTFTLEEKLKNALSQSFSESSPPASAMDSQINIETSGKSNKFIDAFLNAAPPVTSFPLKTSSMEEAADDSEEKKLKAIELTLPPIKAPSVPMAGHDANEEKQIEAHGERYEEDSEERALDGQKTYPPPFVDKDHKEDAFVTYRQEEPQKEAHFNYSSSFSSSQSSSTSTSPSSSSSFSATDEMYKDDSDREISPSSMRLLEKAWRRGKAWLLGGNLVLRIGIFILFLGIAFLLRYESQNIEIPMYFRYMAVALGGLILFAIGFKVSVKKPSYGLVLEGTGVAILYMTTLASMRIPTVPLLSTPVGFALMVGITIGLVALAVKQNALPLALVAVVGGFLAPILVSTGSGNHIALFSYFSLLNMGIILIAWYKTWRVLNVAGFIGTFSLGFAWGIRSYIAPMFISTEPFLILFFLMYVTIGLLFTRRRLLEAENPPDTLKRGDWLRWSTKKTDYLDGTLVFGPPIIGFSLQNPIIEHIENGIAISAFILGIFYLILTFVFTRGTIFRKVTLLREICLALGVGFITLSVPLAFGANIISGVWAVEAASVYWLGLRRSHKLSRFFSIILMIVSACIYLTELRGIRSMV